MVKGKVFVVNQRGKISRGIWRGPEQREKKAESRKRTGDGQAVLQEKGGESGSGSESGWTNHHVECKDYE